jgi:hypothetical protein
LINEFGFSKFIFLISILRHQMNNLKRQKEMLEQKIMEHYKNTPSQKQKNNNNHNLMDMFSSKTRQLVQKVRNKSSTTNQSECNSKSSNDLTNNELEKANSTKMSAFCHKYSADDVNYLSIQPKLETAINGSSTSKQQIVSCLSSSSTSSSSSSSSSSCIPEQTNGNGNTHPHEQLNSITPPKESTNSKLLVANARQTPNSKLDPKSLKLGRRPVSICSSTCSSPLPLTSSPTTVSISHSRTPNQLDVSRNLMSKLVNQSPTSSCSSSTYSSASLLSKVTTAHTPPFRGNALIKDATPITALITKKPNLNSIQLLNSSPINAGKPLVSNGKPQRIAARIADSLSKLRTSSDMPNNNYEDIIEPIRDEREDEDEDEEDEDDDNEHVKKYSNLCKDARLNASNSSSGKQHSVSKTSNEIWLEYGCI